MLARMTFDYRSLMSGRRTDIPARVMRGGLWLGSKLYGFGSAYKNRGFDTGRCQIHRCEATVISVGNLTTGGTGKTPVVCFLASWFRRHQRRVAIVSRGYGRGDADSNDEAMEMDWRLPDVPHVQDADRVEAARIATEELESEFVLLDDGFQHRRLHRDLDIVLIDATCPFGYGHQLPRGLLRESVGGLQRADVVLITRCGPGRETSTSISDNASELYEPTAAIQELVQHIETLVRPETPICLCDHRPSRLLEHPETTIAVAEFKRDAQTRVAMISGIGNPDAFAITLAECGFEVAHRRDLPDHHAYTPESVAELREWVTSISDEIDFVVCTHKDLVKLQTDRIGGKPLRALLIDLVMLSNENKLDKVLSSLL